MKQRRDADAPKQGVTHRPLATIGSIMQREADLGGSEADIGEAGGGCNAARAHLAARDPALFGPQKSLGAVGKDSWRKRLRLHLRQAWAARVRKAGRP